MFKLFSRFLKKKNQGERAFQSAILDRLNAEWVFAPTHINKDLSSLETMKSRCRDAAKNDGNMKKYISMRQTNIVGPNGITLISNIKDFKTEKPDKIANAIIESKYEDFSKKKNFSVDEQSSRTDVENLIVASLAYDGEIFIRIIPGYNNKYQFAIQVLDSINCKSSRNETLPNGNQIVNGIEINGFGKPLRYHFEFGNTTDPYCNFKRVAIPAEQVIHLFYKEYPEQNRGIPLAQSGIKRLNYLQGAAEAELIAARLSACKTAFYTRPKGESFGNEADIQADGTLRNKLAPGTIDSLPEGWGISTIDPTHPNGNFAEFAKVMMRDIANAWNVSYNELANDLEGVNYSSIRQGVMFERDCWSTEQQFLINNFETIIFNKWLEINLINGNLAPLPYSKIEKFANRDKWQPRSWEWVDPLKDAQANEIKVKNGWTTNNLVTSKQGGDYYDNLDQIKQEQDAAKKLGIEKQEEKPKDKKEDLTNSDKSNEE